MNLSSPVFAAGGMIPKKYGRSHENINPPLIFEDVPSETVSFVLLLEDPDVPPQAGVPVWDHWVVFNIPPSVREIPEARRVEGVRGQGTRGELDYGGPKPPDREHRYFFKVFALDTTLDLPEGATKKDVLAALDGHVLSEAALMGRYAPDTI